ncbi:hypothetical protein JCM24511_00852 [Saitozyma sp. JCM 24511]|nr:hypothetical protein JCM24511_00852 [Saitozyma sp. JCM 24511]
MAHVRRIGGRFTTNTASEAYQRQLTAPVHKWKKAWVAPSGLQPESSYKICKWVRIDEAEDDLADEGDEDVEEGDEAEEGDEGEGEGEGEGDVDEGGEEGDDAAVTTAKATPALTPAPGATVTEPATPMETDSEMPPPATIVIAEPTPEVTPAPESGLEPETVPATATAPAPAALAPEATPTPTPTPGDREDAVPGEITPAEDSIEEGSEPVVTAIPVEAAPAPAEELPSHEIPSNAIEMSNTAPGSTEVGHGDLGAEAGVEITLPTPHSPGKTAEEAAAEHATGVVELESSVEAHGVTDTAEVEVADEPMDVDEPAPPVPAVRDEGLTMADHEPERKEFEVEPADEPREVALPGEDA